MGSGADKAAIKKLLKEIDEANFELSQCVFKDVDVCDCTKDYYGICKKTGDKDDCQCAINNLGSRL